ncbi:hypothetical protein KKB10_06195 [Patescibacteria group bacterium]|nr:hypothetical protein [Patescibacteria group bacterium]MBU1075590.1 hypothetical protein [Patescibacteria group bacterium]MBU1952125.1 hypothetical protein [Patescibacteria group bacterium]
MQEDAPDKLKDLHALEGFQQFLDSAAGSVKPALLGLATPLEKHPFDLAVPEDSTIPNWSIDLFYPQEYFCKALAWYLVNGSNPLKLRVIVANNEARRKNLIYFEIIFSGKVFMVCEDADGINRTILDELFKVLYTIFELEIEIVIASSIQTTTAERFIDAQKHLCR